MEDTNFKQTEEILSEIYRNAQLALQSIANILPQVEDDEVKNELSYQHEEYEKFSARAAMLAKDKGLELKEPNPFKKMMMWGSIKMNSMMDNSRAHIADMMLQGTLMGITALRKSQSETCIEGADDVLQLLDEMIAAEERFEKKWKEYL
ncbi:MAG: hypothetical protein E7355_02475 [Clostridiales bacterium]|nr:hypothetical protein [Clostridiales bacterium]